MKNFMILAFFLVVEMCFANVSSFFSENQSVEETPYDCFTVTYSCGVSGPACNITDMEEFMDELDEIDQEICG